MREIFPVHYEMRRRGTVPLAIPLIKISPDLSGSQRDFPEQKGRGSRRGKKWGWGGTNKKQLPCLISPESGENIGHITLLMWGS